MSKYLGAVNRSKYITVFIFKVRWRWQIKQLTLFFLPLPHFYSIKSLSAFLFLLLACGMLDLSSLISDQTGTPYLPWKCRVLTIGPRAMSHTAFYPCSFSLLEMMLGCLVITPHFCVIFKECDFSFKKIFHWI